VTQIGSLMTHRRSSLNGVGRLDVPRKLAMKACRNSSHERMDSGARLLSHTLAASLRCSCSSCRALSVELPPIMIAVTKSSSQIIGSCCPLNLAMHSLILIPFGKGMVRMYVLKHSAPQSSSSLSPRASCSPSPLNRRASRCARAVLTLC
jgi:hypothetical protein